MDLRRRSCKCEDWYLHWAKLFLLVLTLGLFIGIDILDRGFKIDVWTNISYSFITISNFFKGISGIDQLVLTYFLVLMMFWAIALAFNVKLSRKPYVTVS
ncbi:hypothetical protein ACFLQ4_00630 [Bacteroidota bacterium]